MRVCWAHGAAQGVWKEMTRRVVAGREEVYEEKSSGVLISLRVDMMQGQVSVDGRYIARR